MTTTDVKVLEFQAETQKFVLAFGLIADLDLDKIVETIDYAHAIGPFMDPTGYRDALQRGDMDALCRVMRALKPALDVWAEEIAPKLADAQASIPR